MYFFYSPQTGHGWLAVRRLPKKSVGDDGTTDRTRKNCARSMHCRLLGLKFLNLSIKMSVRGERISSLWIVKTISTHRKSFGRIAITQKEKKKRQFVLDPYWLLLPLPQRLLLPLSPVRDYCLDLCANVSCGPLVHRRPRIVYGKSDTMLHSDHQLMLHAVAIHPNVAVIPAITKWRGKKLESSLRRKKNCENKNNGKSLRAHGI